MHEGVDGLLRDKSRPPGKAPIPPDRVAEIVRLTQQPPPHEATHWTRDGEDGWRCRVDGPGDLEGARPQPASLDELQAVHRSGLRRQTHRHRALGALCVALSAGKIHVDRTQPGLPLKKGRGATMTHDYKRNGTTTLFAALNVLDGTVIGQNMARHRHQEFIRFLNRIERAVPAGSTIHVILDNYAAHKHEKVQAWLRPPSALDVPLHADLVLMVECGRRLLRQADETTAQARRLPLRRRPPGRNQSLREPAQRITDRIDGLMTGSVPPDHIIAARNRGFQTLESIHYGVGPSRPSRPP